MGPPECRRLLPVARPLEQLDGPEGVVREVGFAVVAAGKRQAAKAYRGPESLQRTGGENLRKAYAAAPRVQKAQKLTCFNYEVL